MSRTATIIAEMKADHAEAMSAHTARMAVRADCAEKGRVLPSPLRERTTSRLNASQAAAKVLLIKGLNDGMGNSWNVAKMTASAAKRVNGQMAYASRSGKQTPDMLASLMAFFQSPGQLAHQVLLASTAPAQVPASLAKSLLADEFVVDVIEGLGFKAPAATALAKQVSRSSGKGRGAGRGRPRRVTLTDRWYAALAPIYGPENIQGIPTSDRGVAAGQGHSQGAGWDAAHAQGRALSPAQQRRMDAYLDGLHDEAARLAQVSE